MTVEQLAAEAARDYAAVALGGHVTNAAHHRLGFLRGYFTVATKEHSELAGKFVDFAQAFARETQREGSRA